MLTNKTKLTVGLCAGFIFAGVIGRRIYMTTKIKSIYDIKVPDIFEKKEKTFEELLEESESVDREFDEDACDLIEDEDDDICGPGPAICIKEENRRTLSVPERKKIKEMVRAMDEEQMNVVLENIPIEVIFRHIENELLKSRKFTRSIQEAMSAIE